MLCKLWVPLHSVLHFWAVSAFPKFVGSVCEHDRIHSYSPTPHRVGKAQCVHLRLLSFLLRDQAQKVPRQAARVE